MVLQFPEMVSLLYSLLSLDSLAPFGKHLLFSSYLACQNFAAVCFVSFTITFTPQFSAYESLVQSSFRGHAIGIQSLPSTSYP